MIENNINKRIGWYISPLLYGCSTIKTNFAMEKTVPLVAWLVLHEIKFIRRPVTKNLAIIDVGAIWHVFEHACYLIFVGICLNTHVI